MDKLTKIEIEIEIEAQASCQWQEHKMNLFTWQKISPSKKLLKMDKADGRLACVAVSL